MGFSFRNSCENFCEKGTLPFIQGKKGSVPFLRDAAEREAVSMRRVYSVLGLLVVAWLAFYLSSYGVLVHSDPLPHVVRMHGDFTGTRGVAAK